MSPGGAFAAVRHLHRNERCLAWAATPVGRAAVVVLAGGLLLPTGTPLANLALAALALVQFAPELRRQILSLAGVAVIYQLLGRSWDWSSGAQELPSTPLNLVLAMVAGVVGASYLVYLAAAHFERWPRWVRRRPLLLLHALLCAVVLALPLAAPARSDGWLQLYAASLLFLMWRFSYLVQAGRRGKVAATSFQDQFFVLLPVFGGTNVAYGKGLENLARREAQEPRAIAATQLAGLKLLWLAWLWIACLGGIGVVIHGDGSGGALAALGLPEGLAWSFGLPRLAELIAAGGDASAGQGWLAVFVQLFTRTLELAVEGHLIVGMLRLFGFNVFRNTYKPLLAETLVDFWGRFHYYFKELLVDFFFLPSYVRWFRKQPRLRMFVAVFAAAGVGNLYFHVVAQAATFAHREFDEIVASFAPRALYSLLLAFGIFVSMQRQQARRAAPALASRAIRLRRIAGVWLFFALIHVFSLDAGELDLAERLAFVQRLVGLGG